jgi:hypothetical protein
MVPFNTKTNELLVHATIWINLENMLNKQASHKRFYIVLLFHFYEMTATDKPLDTESRLGVLRGQGYGEMRSDYQ